MDTVKQCSPQPLANTNIVPADGAPGLERERERERERDPLLNHHLCPPLGNSGVSTVSFN